MRRVVVIFLASTLGCTIALWIASYWTIMYVSNKSPVMVMLRRGSVECWDMSKDIGQRANWQMRWLRVPDGPRFRVLGVEGQGSSPPIGGFYQRMVGGTVRRRLPLWMPLVAAGIPLSLLTLVPWRRRRNRVNRGCCDQCGYRCDGLFEQRCPECGQTLPDRAFANSERFSPDESAPLRSEDSQ